MNSPVFLADSDHLAPAMNDVEINAVDGKRVLIYLLAAVRSWPEEDIADKWQLRAPQFSRAREWGRRTEWHLAGTASRGRRHDNGSRCLIEAIISFGTNIAPAP